MGLLDMIKGKKQIIPNAEATSQPAKADVTNKAVPRVKGNKASTLGELKASGYRAVPLREEMRRNLLDMIRKKQDFPWHHRF